MASARRNHSFLTRLISPSELVNDLFEKAKYGEWCTILGWLECWTTDWLIWDVKTTKGLRGSRSSSSSIALLHSGQSMKSSVSRLTCLADKLTGTSTKHCSWQAPQATGMHFDLQVFFLFGITIAANPGIQRCKAIVPPHMPYLLRYYAAAEAAMTANHKDSRSSNKDENKASLAYIFC